MKINKKLNKEELRSVRGGGFYIMDQISGRILEFNDPTPDGGDAVLGDMTDPVTQLVVTVDLSSDTSITSEGTKIFDSHKLADLYRDAVVASGLYPNGDWKIVHIRDSRRQA